MKKIFLFSVLLMFVQSVVFSQIMIQTHTGIGKSNISNGVYSQFATALLVSKQSHYVRMYNNWQFMHDAEKKYNNFSLEYLYSLNVKGVYFFPCAGYRYNLLSSELREHNFIAAIGLVKNRFSMYLGNNSRIYTFSNKYIKDNNLVKGPDTRIAEPRNLMYAFSYNLFQREAKWSATASILNFDMYYIEQETNPFFKLAATYKLKNNLTLLSSIVYKRAGLLNIKVNKFGYFLRLGIEWKLR